MISVLLFIASIWLVFLTVVFWTPLKNSFKAFIQLGKIDDKQD
jgi:hypothetical protein